MPPKAPSGKSKTAGVNDKRRRRQHEKQGNADATELLTVSLKEAWLPHFRMLADNLITAADDHAIKGVVKEVDQALLRAGMDLLRIDDGKNGGAANSLRKPSLHGITAAALRHFLDCAIVSSGDDTEATLRVFQLIAGVALATRTVHAMVDRATEFSVTLLDRVRSNSLLFLKQVIVAMSSPRSNQVQKSSSLSDDLENDDRRDDENAILDAISEALTFACTDKSKMVRQSAVNACQALLSLDSVESDVLQSVIWVSQHDPVARNRVAGIQALPLRAETVEVVVARVRDVSTLVRVAALRKLHKLDALDAELCAAIVQSGYTERCPETRQATIDLIAAWLQAVDNNPVKLLEALNVTFYEKQCETVVRVLLDLSPRDRASDFHSCLLAYLSGLWTDDSEELGGKLSIETLFLARVVSKEQSTILDSLDWDVPQVTAVLERTIDRLRSQILQDEEDKDLASIEHTGFVCQQLVLLASVLAAAEVGAARHLQGVLSLRLSDPSTPDVLIDTAIRALFAPVIVQDGDSRAISASRVDETTDIVVQCIQTLQGLREQVSAGAEEYYEIRILSIWTVLLDHLPLLTPEVEKLVRAGMEPMLLAVLSATESPQEGDDGPDKAYADLIREAAVSCLGKLGLLLLVTYNHSDATVVDETVRDRIHDYRSRLVAVASDLSYKAEIRAQAILALVDWAVTSQNEDKGAPLHDLDDLLLSWLDLDDLFLLCVAGEVAVKLLFARKALPSSKVLLARLVLFSLDGTLAEGEPQSDADCDIGSPVRLQQLASFFLPAYASTNAGRSSLVGCLPSALDRTSAKKTSRIVSYVCDVARRGLAADSEARSEQKTCVVDVVSVETAIELASFVVATEPSGSFLLAICKTLGGMPLLKDGMSLPASPPRLPRNVRRLLVCLSASLDELGMSVDNQRAINELGYLQSTLAAFNIGNPDDESVSSGDDEDSAPSNVESVDEKEKDAESISSREFHEPEASQDQDDDSKARNLTRAFSMVDYFGNNKENSRTSRGRASHANKSHRKFSSESVLISVDEAAPVHDPTSHDGSSAQSAPKQEESVLRRSSDASALSLESRRLSSRSSGSQVTASSKGGKSGSGKSVNSLLGMFGDDSDGDELRSSSYHAVSQPRSKARG